MGLALEPRLLILDEPTQGLAAGEIDGFKALVREIAATATVLLIEHNMDVVMDLADRITVLDFGRTLADGTPAGGPRRPGGAGGVPRAMKLAVEGLDGGLRRRAGAARPVAGGGGRRGAVPDGPQRRRQVDGAEGDHGAGAGDGGVDPAGRHPARRAAGARGAAARRRLGAAGAAALRRADRRGKPRDRADDAQPRRPDPRAGAGAVSAAARADGPGLRHAVGRRAADAGDRPRALHPSRRCCCSTSRPRGCSRR